MKYYIRGKFYRGEIDIDADYYVHNDIITDSDGQKFKVSDPWYNRLLRKLFGRNYKRLIPIES